MFLTRHLGNPVPSPALFDKIGNRFVRDVKAFAATNGIPILRLKKPDRTRWDDRKIDHVRPIWKRRSLRVGSGWWRSCPRRSSSGCSPAGTGRPRRGWCRSISASSRVGWGRYYFYILDREFGVGFIKICTYFPYPAKVWVNGHEWAKRQADDAGIGYTALANGFATGDDPAGLQAICDRFGPRDVQSFFDRSTAVIPTPFTAADRSAG